ARASCSGEPGAFASRPGPCFRRGARRWLKPPMARAAQEKAPCRCRSFVSLPPSRLPRARPCAQRRAFALSAEYAGAAAVHRRGARPPIAMTVLLSFHDWGQYKGIEPVPVLKNWREVLSDGYFHEMFLRTFRSAALVVLLTATFGAPEAYILSRMRDPWRGIFLLVVLGPLLISVVARTLGWALLFGG